MEFHARAVYSLKAKRQIVKSIKERISLRYNISIIESGAQDAWQRFQLTCAMVSNQKIEILKTFDEIEEFIIFNYPVTKISVEKEFN